MLTISRTRLLTGAAALALTASLGATPGFAQQTVQDTMNVTASVQQSCTVNTLGDIDFGVIDPGVEASADAQFNVNCSFAGDVTVEVGNGGNHDGTWRRMANGTGLIRYQLWQSSARSQQWDAPETVTVQAGDTPFDVHGVVPGSFSDGASVGNYSDTVTISVTF